MVDVGKPSSVDCLDERVVVALVDPSMTSMPHDQCESSALVATVISTFDPASTSTGASNGRKAWSQLEVETGGAFDRSMPSESSARNQPARPCAVPLLVTRHVALVLTSPAPASSSDTFASTTGSVNRSASEKVATYTLFVAKVRSAEN